MLCLPVRAGEQELGNAGYARRLLSAAIACKIRKVLRKIHQRARKAVLDQITPVILIYIEVNNIARILESCTGRGAKKSKLLNCITVNSKPGASTAHTNTVTIKATTTKGKAHTA